MAPGSGSSSFSYAAFMLPTDNGLASLPSRVRALLAWQVLLL